MNKAVIRIMSWLYFLYLIFLTSLKNVSHGCLNIMILDKEDIDRKRRKLIPNYHQGGGGFSSMKPSIGGSGNGGNGGADGSNGMQNGGCKCFWLYLTSAQGLSST